MSQKIIVVLKYISEFVIYFIRALRDALSKIDSCKELLDS